MNIIKFPNKEDYAKICERPQMDVSQLNSIVEGVLRDVKENGDKAVIAYEEKMTRHSSPPSPSPQRRWLRQRRWLTRN